MKAKKVLDILKETAADGIQDEVGKFWVVTAATQDSVLEDILFEATIAIIMKQAKGGLEADEIMMITKDENKAKKYAEKLLYI